MGGKTGCRGKEAEVSNANIFLTTSLEKNLEKESPEKGRFSEGSYRARDEVGAHPLRSVVEKEGHRC